MANTIEQATVAPLVKYDVNEAALAKTREECATLTCDTPQGYEAVRVAIGHLRTTRVAIEKRRVELKADALAFGRLVDSEAKRFTAMITEIESPLAAKKAAVDDEKERIKREAEAEKIRALEAEIAANRARQEAEAKALRDAEEARLADERKALEAERAALAEERRQAEAKAAEAERVEAAKREAERAKLAEERRAEEERQRAARKIEEERQRAEREAIEQERRKVAAEREKAERIEFERQAKIKAEAEAIAKAERDRIAAAEQAAKLAALAPDVEKVRAFSAAIRALPVPKGRTKDAKAVISEAVAALDKVASTLDYFGVA